MTATQYLDRAKELERRVRHRPAGDEEKLLKGQLNALIAIAEVMLMPPKQYVINTHDIEEIRCHKQK
ncbi:hypothetical protein PBI_CHE12_46 [Mycobacterium phage Che12]|uniref:Uncharacterized protein n=1 Tax=Mycobacterium phage Che12 TaxID=2911435 RepID=Q1A0H1_9CAUD|nr:gp46 [Mycobacterium phage Che12]ABE67365.1 hypothetical protein PBI_CHE12_46 [Mycobacterium phage Che12]